MNTEPKSTYFLSDIDIEFNRLESEFYKITDRLSEIEDDTSTPEYCELYHKMKSISKQIQKVALE